MREQWRPAKIRSDLKIQKSVLFGKKTIGVRLGRMAGPQRHKEHELSSRTGNLGQRLQENQQQKKHHKTQTSVTQPLAALLHSSVFESIGVLINHKQQNYLCLESVIVIKKLFKASDIVIYDTQYTADIIHQLFNWQLW